MNRTERMAVIAAKLVKTSFYKMPASTIHHSNVSGGLYDHSINMWLNLEKLTQQLGLTWENSSSPFVIAMLHDACKIDAYVYNHDYKCWEHNDEHPAGYGDLSLKVIEELGIDLTNEEKACIRWHMGAFDESSNWNNFTNAIHEYPNVLWVHVADMMATHIDEIKDRMPQDGKHCCLCGREIETFGNNPEPILSEGVCCDECNNTMVIPVRLGRIIGGVCSEE